MTVREAYEAKYASLREGYALSCLGGDHNQIIDEFEARLGQPDPLLEMMGMPPSTAEDLADGVHHAIMRAIESAYFGRISRDQAIVICSTLAAAPYSTLTIHDGLNYNDSTFRAAWHDAHPDEDRIYLDADYI